MAARAAEAASAEVRITELERRREAILVPPEPSLLVPAGEQPREAQRVARRVTRWS